MGTDISALERLGLTGGALDLIGGAVQLSHPVWAEWVSIPLFIVGTLLLLVALWPTGWLLIQKRVRMPFIDLCSIATQKGWRFADIDNQKDESYHLFDFRDGLRQAGRDGTITFYGRPLRKGVTASVAPLEEIPTIYWRDYAIYMFSAMEMRGGAIIGVSANNSTTHTGNLSDHEGRYRDLHVNRKQAIGWLKHKAKSFMGNNRKRYKDVTR